MTSKEGQNLKQKQSTIKQHMKPMITLLLVILCRSALGLIYAIIYMLSTVLDASEYADGFMDYVVNRNIGYLASSICVWLLLQESPRADDKGLETSFLQR